LPAIGASVIAANQETGYILLILYLKCGYFDGKYCLDLIPGKYNIVVAFPDGTSQTYNYIIVERDSLSMSNQQSFVNDSKERFSIVV